MPEGHLTLLISDVLDRVLNLSPICSAYETGDGRGQPPYHPALVVNLLLYTCCMGKSSSRKMDRATHAEAPCRVSAAKQHPDVRIRVFNRTGVETPVCLTR